jgi:Mat/Ecp fimbriae major subunit
MKFSMIKAVSAAAVLAAGVSASAANAATASADAKATILASLVVTKNTDLDFGTVAVNTAGSRTISNAGLSTACTGGVCAGTVSAADFDITGLVGSNILITVPTSVTLTRASGTETMSASLTNNATAGSHALTAGEGFNVGGTLSWGATQVAGDYVGSFDVTVEYQ